MKKTWRLGIFVTVDVEAGNETDAWAVAERACNFPGEWRHSEPIVVTGELMNKPVSAIIIRSQTLTIQQLNEENK